MDDFNSVSVWSELVLPSDSFPGISARESRRKGYNLVAGVILAFFVLMIWEGLRLSKTFLLGFPTLLLPGERGEIDLLSD